MILDHTLIASLENTKDKSPTDKILLTSRYRFPWQLHLNRRTRKLVAHQYLANSVFQLPNATCYARGRPTLEAWLINVDPLYFGLITKIRLDCRKAKMSCMDKLCIAVDDVAGCGDAVENACGYELDESVFQIVTNPVFKKRAGQKKDTGEYTVKEARELGDSPWIHPAYVDRLN
ncbi:unnamed protein product [Cercospora beticola]|nr:unnamed protein product [Cercospora beticola]